MSWKKVKLADIAEVFSGYAFKCSDMNTERGTPLIKIKNISNSKVSPECDTFIDIDVNLEKYERYKLRRDDFLVAMTGQGSVGRIGKMHQYGQEYYVNQRVAIVRIDPNKANPVFVFSQIATTANEIVLFKKSSGAGQPNISAKQIGELDVLLPNMSLQSYIADILSTYDNLIENNQKQIKLLEEAAQRLYKEWFVDLRFPGYENTPIVDGVPQGWEKAHLSKIAQLSAGGDKPDVFSKVKNSVCNIPVYSNGVTDEGLYGYTDSASVISNCITISARGNVGYTCLRRTPFLPIVRLITVIPQIDCVEYLYFYLKNMTFKSNGAAQQQITVPMIKDEEIILPCNNLLLAFKEKASLIFDMVDHLKLQETMCKEARDRLLPKLMSGEIEV